MAKKNNISMGDLKRQYAPKYEMCLYGTKGKGHELYGKREADILCFSRTNNEFHPTEKPVKLIEYLIQHSTKQGDIVLDAFAGSFSTGVACINTNRKFIGIEIDPKYFEIGKQRMEQAYKMQKDYGEW